MAAKKTKAAPSKAAFVRSIDVGVPAKDVISQAKEAGIALTESYVYNVRGAVKAASKKKRAARKSQKPKATGPAASAPRAKRTAGSAEDLLKAVAAEIGLASAIAILQAERDRVRAVLGG